MEQQNINSQVPLNPIPEEPKKNWFSQHIIAASVIGILLLVVIAVGIYYQVSHSVPNTPQTTQQQPSTSTNTQSALSGTKVDPVFSVTWNNLVYYFENRCEGNITADGGQVVSVPINGNPGYGKFPYCVGNNTLAAINTQTNAYKIIDQQTVTDPQKAPVLESAALIQPGSTNPNVLVAYFVDTCATFNDCGVGQPGGIDYVFNLNDFTFRKLVKYPNDGMFGAGIWNASGSKALFVDKGGGAGCDVSAITGYDLIKDASFTTKEVGAACGNDQKSNFDGNGNPVDYWTNVHWVNDTQAAATLVSAKDGSQKTVAINFY